MSAPILKVRVFQRALIKTKADVRFPARIVDGPGIKVTRADGTFTFELDFAELPQLANFDPQNFLVAVLNVADGTYSAVSLAAVLSNPSAIQVVTEAGDVAVAENTRLLVMNRAVDESPSNIYLPASLSKVGGVKVVDFKGNAGAFPHDVHTQGADEFQGGLTQWSLGADGASAMFDPIPGIGYSA